MQTAIFLTVAVLIAVADAGYVPYGGIKSHCHGYYAEDPFCSDKTETDSDFYVNPKDCSCYYQCVKGHSTSYAMSCAPGTMWCQRLKTCVHANVYRPGFGKPHCWEIGTACNQYYPTAIPPVTRHPSTCNGFDANDSFCSSRNVADCIANHKTNYKDYYRYQHDCFYHTYEKDCSCFYQCDEFGRTNIMPCAPGTRWDQGTYACVHDNGSCKSVYGK